MNGRGSYNQEILEVPLYSPYTETLKQRWAQIVTSFRRAVVKSRNAVVNELQFRGV